MKKRIENQKILKISKTVRDGHLYLDTKDGDTIAELSSATQRQYFAMANSIRKIMSVFNGLEESRKHLSVGGAKAVERSAATLAAYIYQRIDALNEFVSVELDNARKPKKTPQRRYDDKKKSGKSRRKTKKKTAKKKLKKAKSRK